MQSDVAEGYFNSGVLLGLLGLVTNVTVNPLNWGNWLQILRIRKAFSSYYLVFFYLKGFEETPTINLSCLVIN